MAKRAMIWARVEDETIKALDEIVAAGPGDRSDHIRQAVETYIHEQKRRARFMDALTVAMANGDGDYDSGGMIPS